MTTNSLTEVGVYYRQVGTGETLRPVDFLFTYNWLHIPSGEEGEFTISIFSGHRSDLLKLLDHWNGKSKDWKYWS